MLAYKKLCRLYIDPLLPILALNNGQLRSNEKHPDIGKYDALSMVKLNLL